MLFRSGHLADRSGGSAGSVFGVGAAAWLLANGVPLDTGLGRIGLIPLGLSLLVAWRLARAGAQTTRAIGGRRSRSLRLSLAAAGGVALVHALLGTVVAGLAGGAGVTVPVLRATLTLGMVGLVTALAGALRESGLAAATVQRLPRPVRDGVRTGLVAALLVVASGAGVVGLALALAAGDATDIVAAYRTGVAGQAGLILVCLVYGPNVVVWAASYLLGPGFAVGIGTTVSMGEVRLGPLPALPLFAALPEDGASALAALLLALPLAAGMAAGWLLARRQLRAGEVAPGRRGWFALLGAAALAGPVSGVLLGVAAMVSGGPIGSGRLTEIGPSGWPVAGVACLVVGVGAAAAAAATRVLMAVRGRGQ